MEDSGKPQGFIIGLIFILIAAIIAATAISAAIDNNNAINEAWEDIVEDTD